MEIAVVAELMPAAHDFAQCFGMVVCPAPADKKGRFCVVFVQHVEHGGDIFGTPIHVDHDGNIFAVCIAVIIDAVGKFPRRGHADGQKTDDPDDQKQNGERGIGEDGELCDPFQYSLPLFPKISHGLKVFPFQYIRKKSCL